MKISILATAIALGLGLAGQAYAFNSNTIQVDLNGTAAGGLTNVDVFDWLPGNAVTVGGMGVAGQTGLSPTITTLYQAQLNNTYYTAADNHKYTTGLSGAEITLQATLNEIQVGVGTSTATFTAISGTVNFYYDTAQNSNDLAGTGFGDGTLILSATVVGGSGSFTDQYRQAHTPIPGFGPLTICDIVPTTPACLLTPLDSYNGDSLSTPGHQVLTHLGNGSSTIDMHVTYQNSDFFKSTLTDLNIALNDTTNLADPFVQTDPSTNILGHAITLTPVGTDFVNGADCPTSGGAFTTTCDFQFQSDGSSSFASSTTVPEPATLALLGLGLMGLGVMRKRM